MVDEMEGVCSGAPLGVNCEVNAGPYFGFTLGVGGGVLAQVSEDVGLRGDLVLQYLNISGPSAEISGAGERAELSLKQYGTRFWLMGGVEV